MDAIFNLQCKLEGIAKIRGMAAKLARAAGVEPSTVSDWQHKRCLPSFDKLDAIASVFGMTVGELFMASQEESSGRAVPLVVSSAKGTVRDAATSSQTRALEHLSLRHIARFVLEQLDEAARLELFVDFTTTGVDRNPRRESRRRPATAPNISRRPHEDRGKTA
jgi:transcriptional regulator with XRE-family HTH domain